MTRKVVLLVCLVAALVAWRIASRSLESSSAAAPLIPVTQGSKIYFIPIGNFPAQGLDSLVEYYRQKYGLDINVVRSIPLDESTRDSARQQIIAEKLVSSLNHSFSKLASDPKAILIGFTSEDIYPASRNWQFAFGWRQASSRTAVVSTARLNLRSDAAFASDIAATRLRKLVTKDIGLLYYGLPQSRDSKSVLYGQIMGIDELDQASEDF